MPQLPSTGLILVPQPPISMASVSAGNTSVGARHCPLVFVDVKATRGDIACVQSRHDVTAGVTSRQIIHTGGSVPILEMYTWGYRHISPCNNELTKDNTVR